MKYTKDGCICYIWKKHSHTMCIPLFLVVGQPILSSFLTSLLILKFVSFSRWHWRRSLGRSLHSGLCSFTSTALGLRVVTIFVIFIDTKDGLLVCLSCTNMQAHYWHLNIVMWVLVPALEQKVRPTCLWAVATWMPCCSWIVCWQNAIEPC